MRNTTLKKLVLACLLAALPACSSESASTTGADTSTGTDTGTSTATSGKSDDEYREEAVTGMHDLLLSDLDAMVAGAKDLQAAAPTPPDRGWDATLDADAIKGMKEAWIKARAAYEHCEGALAPLFPNIDYKLDARYDDFLADLTAQGGDKDLFDNAGATGMHAIERIVWSDQTPTFVIDFEKTLPGYMPAAFPATAAEAADFKSKLCEQFIKDADEMRAQWTPANIDVAIAFQGLISLVTEQREKVQKAASSEEESRYSQRTMADLRQNLAGARDAYAVFQPWLLSKVDDKDPKKDGKTIDANILKGFDELDAAYKAVSGDGIPQPPPTWSSLNPTEADLMTPFGELFSAVNAAVDPTIEGSVVAEMELAAAAMGFPTL